MDKRKRVWYSVIRYSPDELSGEVINVGVVLHSMDTTIQTKYFILDENSQKLKALISNKASSNTYKSFKDIFEYYLSKSKDNLLGSVGNITISSYYDSDFLKDLCKYFENKKITLTEPSFAFTENIDMLFNSLFKTYIGEQYLVSEPTTMTAKKYVRSIFEEKKLLGKKVKPDLILNPIDNLDEVQIRVDFSFKNGVWNYLQAIPVLNGPAANSEWFAKTQLMVNNLKGKDVRIHLLYRPSDFEKNDSAYSLINYFLNNSKNVTKMNIEEQKNIIELCEYIEKEAENIEEQVAS